MMFLPSVRPLGLALCVFIARALASFAADGQTVIVDGKSYYVPSSPISSLAASPAQLSAGMVEGLDLVPLTVIEDTSSGFTPSMLDAVIQNYSAVDDVFTTGFLQTIYLKHTGPAPASLAFGSNFTSYGADLIILSSAYANESLTCDVTADLPPGPYFLEPATGGIYQAWLLYSDVNGAFTEAVIMGSDGNFSTLSAQIEGAVSLTIGVPSRLYFTKTTDQPLAGVRIGVKDIFDLAGVRTSCGNRAYYELYLERNATAYAVQLLIDAGAVIVGHMKTSQFANGETATDDWVDYHSPYNARGDGYQDPSSSSAGPGAGIGAYEWLDIAIGSDTGGSIRNPSQVNGAFGNRPSHGLVDLTGVMPMSPVLDTAGLITLDPFLWTTTAHVLYQGLPTYTTFPKKIYTIDFPTTASTEAYRQLMAFVNTLGKFLNASVSAMDYDALWNATKPAAAGNQTIEQYLNVTYPILISQQQYELLTTPFYADYAAANGGRRPFIDPSPQIRWGWGQSNPPSALDDEIGRKTAFMQWWNTTVQPTDPETCSDSLVLYVGTAATTTYRNVYRSAPGIPSGFGASRISNFAEIPDFVVPIGQAPYNSTITLKTEYLPVAVDILAAKGCDGMIYQLVEELVNAGIVVPPKPGSSMY